MSTTVISTSGPGKTSVWAETMRRWTDYFVKDFGGGPRPWKFAWVINFQKIGTFPMLAFLIAWYHNSTTAAWIYLAMHGTYGLVWITYPQSTSDNKTTPLILEKSEGEHRVRKPREIPLPTGPFTIKVDRKNGGSQKMWLGTEEIPPGGIIPKHKHLGQDEILLIQTGSAHVWLGTQERDVHGGAIVFIPSDTWVSLKNTGNENINLAFVFSDPGFDEFMRCTSVPLGDPSSENVSRDELKDCQHKGHVVYEGFDSSVSR